MAKKKCKESHWQKIDYPGPVNNIKKNYFTSYCSPKNHADLKGVNKFHTPGNCPTPFPAPSKNNGPSIRCRLSVFLACCHDQFRASTHKFVSCQRSSSTSHPFCV